MLIYRLWFCSNVVKFCVMPNFSYDFVYIVLFFFVFGTSSDFFRLFIGLLLFLLSFFVCYCSGNNHSLSSLLDFCFSCCSWSSKTVGFVYIFCCLFPFMVCQSDSCGCCCQCFSCSWLSSVDANFCKATFAKRLQMPQAWSIPNCYTRFDT